MFPRPSSGSFTAAGDLSGTSSSQTVIGLRTRAVAATAPTNAQVLTWVTANNDWEPAAAGTAALTQNHIFVGNASNVAVDVAMSGDATIVASGAITIANSAVTNVKIANSTIDLTAKVTGVLPIANGGTNASTAAGALANLSGVATGSFSMNSQKITSLLDGTAVSDAATINNVNTIPLNNQSGTSYTLVLTDAGAYITCTNASAIALTIPANASVAFPVGTQIVIEQGGAGQVTVGITSDTLNARIGKKTAGQYAVLYLVKKTATTWTLSGDLAA